MLGILIILLISWILLYVLLNKTGLSILGFTPFLQRIKDFIIGILIMIPITVTIAVIDTTVLEISWKINDTLNLKDLLCSLKYHLISATTEEFIFRGALLIILIKMLGTKTGVLISSAAFGVYHWFSYGMLGGSPVAMVYIFLITGAMGLAFSWSFIKSNTILLPIGMHWAWNYASTMYKDQQPFGEILFHITSDKVLEGWTSLIYSLLTGLIVPLVVIWFVNWYYKNNSPLNSHFR